MDALTHCKDRSGYRFPSGKICATAQGLRWLTMRWWTRTFSAHCTRTPPPCAPEYGQTTCLCPACVRRCLEIFYKPVTLPCQHNFCRACLINSLASRADGALEVRGTFGCFICRRKFICGLPEEHNRILHDMCEARYPEQFVAKLREAERPEDKAQQQQKEALIHSHLDTESESEHMLALLLSLIHI